MFALINCCTEGFSLLEAMDLALAAVQNASHAFVNSVTSSTLGIFILLCLLVKLYCCLTVGMYTGKEDMTGKTVLITGASDGIGKATAHDLAKRNARVLLACRNLKKANKVAEEIRSASGNKNIVVIELDLSSFKSVRNCAKTVLETEEKLHVLINNAGMSSFSFKLSEDGYGLLVQTNHLGPFLLTMLLLDLLKKSAPSRIINVSSFGHYWSKLNLDNLTNTNPASSQFFNYGNSKLLNILFTRELSNRLHGTGVTVNALHPGIVKTKIVRVGTGLLNLTLRLLLLVFGKTPEEGAQTTIRLAVDPSLEEVSGKFFFDCKETHPSKAAMDKSLATLTFNISEKAVQLSNGENNK